MAEQTPKERLDEAERLLDEFEKGHGLIAKTREAGRSIEFSGEMTLEIAEEHNRLIRERDIALRDYFESP